MIEFDKTVVIGLGKLAFQCADHVTRNYGVASALYDANDSPSEFLKRMCVNSEVSYYSHTSNEMFDLLEAEQEKTLVISATNPLIIPERVLKKDNIKAINLHHALLPEHPGRYGEAWAIFEQERGGGRELHGIC